MAALLSTRSCILRLQSVAVLQKIPLHHPDLIKGRVCTRFRQHWRHGRRCCSSSSAIATAPASALAQHLDQQQGINGVPLTLEQAQALNVLRSLAQYVPTGLSDGPASLCRVLPYNAAKYQHALQHGAALLHMFSTYKLSNIAAALAAAGHEDEPFMARLGNEAARQLLAIPAAQDNASAVAQLRAISSLAVAYARLGFQHKELFTQMALSGTKLLQRRCLQPSKRAHCNKLALLAAAFAALKLHPPQLFRAVAELFKQQRRALALLGPQESMLLLWAFAMVGHKDPPAQLLLTQRAATQVGQYDCKGLAHAYTQCAQVRLTAPPLLGALRKATRQRLPAMSPADLTAVLTALAAMGLQDSLLLDEIAKAVRNKMVNYTAGQISSTFSALSILRYRNPWLLDHASRILVSRRLNKVQHFSAAQLADLLTAFSQLRFHNARLFDHLAEVAAETQTLCPSWSAAELAAVLQGFSLVAFCQPQLLAAGAARLVQLAAHQGNAQLQLLPGQSVPLIAAAYHLASMPAASGDAPEGSAKAAAVAAAAAAVVQQHACCSCRDWIKLAISLVLVDAMQTSSSTETWPQQQDVPASTSKLTTASALHQAIPADGQRQQEPCRAATSFALLQQVLWQARTGIAVAAAETGISGLQALDPELLWLMQLLWLAEQQTAGICAQAPQDDARQPQQEGQEQQERQLGSHAAAIDAAEVQWKHMWQLGLADHVLKEYLHQHSTQHDQQHAAQFYCELL